MRRLACTLLLLVAAGCGSDKSTAPKRLEGTYTMQSLGGESLPMVYYQDSTGAEQAELLSGSITINADGTFSAPWSFRVTSNGQISSFEETCTGPFTRTGNSITITETDNGGFCGVTADGEWDGDNTLTFTDEEIVYTR
jgi:hypothetical protein